jgi:hypothetical protein
MDDRHVYLGEWNEVGQEQDRTALPLHGNAPRTIGAAPMSVRDPGEAGLRGRTHRDPVDRTALTPLSRTPNMAIRVVTVVVVMALVVVGCAGPHTPLLLVTIALRGGISSLLSV